MTDPNSREAADFMKPHAQPIRERVFAYIEEQGKRGATCEEVCLGLGLKHQTGSARVNELRNAKRILAAGVRETSSGCRAHVWVTFGEWVK